MPLCKERHYWTSKDGKKFFEKISTFFCQACRSTRIQAVSRYYGPEEGKIWAKDFGRIMKSSCKKKDKVLPLSEKDADVI